MTTPYYSMQLRGLSVSALGKGCSRITQDCTAAINLDSLQVPTMPPILTPPRRGTLIIAEGLRISQSGLPRRESMRRPCLLINTTSSRPQPRSDLLLPLPCSPSRIPCMASARVRDGRTPQRLLALAFQVQKDQLLLQRVEIKRTDSRPETWRGRSWPECLNGK